MTEHIRKLDSHHIGQIIESASHFFRGVSPKLYGGSTWKDKIASQDSWRGCCSTNIIQRFVDSSWALWDLSTHHLHCLLISIVFHGPSLHMVPRENSCATRHINTVYAAQKLSMWNFIDILTKCAEIFVKRIGEHNNNDLIANDRFHSVPKEAIRDVRTLSSKHVLKEVGKKLTQLEVSQDLFPLSTEQVCPPLQPVCYMHFMSSIQQSDDRISSNFVSGQNESEFTPQGGVFPPDTLYTVHEREDAIRINQNVFICLLSVFHLTNMIPHVDSLDKQVLTSLDLDYLPSNAIINLTQTIRYLSVVFPWLASNSKLLADTNDKASQRDVLLNDRSEADIRRAKRQVVEPIELHSSRKSSSLSYASQVYSSLWKVTDTWSDPRFNVGVVCFEQLLTRNVPVGPYCVDIVIQAPIKNTTCGL